MRTTTPAAFLGALLLGFTLGHAGAQSRDVAVPIIEQAAAVHGVSANALVRLIACETGSTFRTDLIGRAGEVGPAQLHPRGLLPTFLAWGYSDPTDMGEAADFTARAISQGMARHWTCWGR